jgi:hypothetical protein
MSWREKMLQLLVCRRPITVSADKVKPPYILNGTDRGNNFNSPVHSFSGLSPTGLTAIFYCLRFKISIFVASYDSQGYGGGIQPRLHTGIIPASMSEAHT